MELTPRLLRIAEEIQPGEKVGDIGTDHGYLPIYLVKKKIAIKVLATDINQEPLNAANKNIKSAGLESQIQTRLGPGTLPLENDALDVIIIAGMGGKLITEILKNSNTLKKTVNRMVLQPMQQQKELRRYLFEQGYKIHKDLLVQEEGRIYEILVVSVIHKEEKGLQNHKDITRISDESRQIPGIQPPILEKYRDLLWELGFNIFENPRNLSLKFLDQKIAQMEKIIKETGGATSEEAIAVNFRAKEKAEKLKEVKKCLAK